MTTTYRIRGDVTWHDGTPFTAQDLVFTQRVLSDRRLPTLDATGGVHLMERSEAPDDRTFVIHWSSPYHEGASLGVRPFFPIPRHVLAPVYDEFLAGGDVQAYLTHRYWTTEFIHTGPFRMIEFSPGERLVFERYEAYFLGRPKLDQIIVRIFSDPNTLLANLLSGEVQMVMDTTFSAETGLQLKQRWEAAKSGAVYAKPGNSWFVATQHKEGVQKEPANLEIPVRRALYHAIDRQALVDVLQGGDPDLVADSFLPLDHPLYQHTKGMLNPFRYDPELAKTMLAEQGWTPGPDGILRHASDGRKYQTSIRGTPGRESETSAFADYWRRIGLEMEEHTIPGARVRDDAYRASIPGWESSSAGSNDRIFNRLAPPVPGRISRTSYDNPEAERLRVAYITSIRVEDQARAVRAIADFWVKELPVLVTYFLVQHMGVYKGVQALHDDWQGGFEGSQAYGTFSRNSHLWDLQ
jgi:peptide/nickel transport system substrate-binding protein